MKNLIIILFTCFSYNCLAQPFLNNSDFVYGEGRARTLEEADKLAFADLVNNIYINIEINSTTVLGDYNGRINRQYQENIDTNNGITIKGSVRYIDDSYVGDGYRVYRYFNKTEYISKIKEKAKLYVKLADDNYYSSFMSGTMNNTIGYYYLAYQCLDDKLIRLIDGENDVFRAQIIAKAKKLISEIVMEIETVDSYAFYLSIYHKNHLMHNIDFEYWDGVKWSDNYIKNNRGEVYKIPHTAYLSCNTNELRYRVVYQTTDEENNKIKLYVPDSFYVEKFVLKY